MAIQRRSPIATAALAAACLFSLAVTAGPAGAESAAVDWPEWQTPEAAGFSSEEIATAERLWQGLSHASQAALFVVYKGRALAAFGASDEPYPCPAVRASLVSVLYGTHLDEIDLQRTLEEVGINDHPSLTRAERQAKVVHLLQSRSGVYHPAACETQAMRDARPERGSRPPGTFWHLNNWDANALATVFWKETGSFIFEEFEGKIARPLGMQDFGREDCTYSWDMRYSIHPCYWFRMSVRDRARLGQLLLQNGRWGNRQIIPATWVAESTTSYSETSLPGVGFGYMWWTFEREFFESLRNPSLHQLRGFGATNFWGQLILVLPDAEMVVAMGADFRAGEGFAVEETSPIIEKILTARETIDLVALRSRATPRTASPGGTVKLAARAKNRSRGASLPTTVDFYLSPSRNVGDEIRWIGRADLIGLAGRKAKTIRTTASLPDDLEPGRYYLIAAVDRDKANYDLERDNNVTLGSRPIEIGEP